MCYNLWMLIMQMQKYGGEKITTFWKQLIYFMMIKIYSDISEISLLLEKD